MTHLGYAIWSYTILKAGAILFVTVPATMMISDCLGDALKMIPSLSWSYLGAEACIISTAQQAKPKVAGQKEDFLAQSLALSKLVIA